MALPVCSNLQQVLAETIEQQADGSGALHRGGTYVCIEGPAFSSVAESQWYRAMGASVIGMTAMPEAKLAREAQIAYAALALVTDYDCWHPQEAHVSAELALENLKRNAARAQRIVREAVQRLGSAPPFSEAHTALANALVTPLQQMSPEVRERLAVLLDEDDRPA
jgi:5'-methylthioadenosine phosphorylase